MELDDGWRGSRFVRYDVGVAVGGSPTGSVHLLGDEGNSAMADYQIMAWLFHHKRTY